MLRLLRPHVGHRPSFRSFAALCLLLCLASSAPATIDAQLNTTGFTPGQASEICVDGLIYSGGTSTSLNGALLTLRFDPAKVALSGVRVATGWTLQGSNLDHASEGWAKIILTNSSGTNGAGQTLNGPIVHFTVTPVNAQVDVDDCQTLRLDGTDSSLSDQDYETTVPSDPCAGRNTTIGPDTGGDSLTTDTTDETSTDSLEGPSNEPLPTPTAKQLAEAVRILKIGGGLEVSSSQDMEDLDLNCDGKIQIDDAVLTLRTPLPEGWYTVQGDAKRSGRTTEPVPPNPVKKWRAVLPGPANGSVVPYPSQGVVSVPDPDDVLSSLPVVYAVLSAENDSRLYRIKDPGSSSSDLSGSNLPNITLDIQVVGTPVVLGNRIYLVGTKATTNGPKACFVRIDAVRGSNGTYTLQEKWRKVLGNGLPESECPVDDIYAAVAMSAPVYSRKATLSHTINIITGQFDNTSVNEGVIATVIDLSYKYAVPGAEPEIASHSFLVGVSAHTGDLAWGYVDEQGKPVMAAYQSYDPDRETTYEDAPTSGTTPGGWHPLAGLAGKGAPAVMGCTALVSDMRGYVNAISLRDGDYLWSERPSDEPFLSPHPVDGSISILDDRIFYGDMGLGGSSFRWISLTLNPDCSGAEINWYTSADNHGWTPPALHRESQTVFCGGVYSIRGLTAHASNPPYSTTAWSRPEPMLTSSAPVVSAAIDSPSATLFVPSETSEGSPCVRVYDLINGDLDDQHPDQQGRLLQVGSTLGDIPYLMSACQGRLYIHSRGSAAMDPNSYITCVGQ